MGNPCSSPKYHSCSGDQICIPSPEAESEIDFKCVSALVPKSALNVEDIKEGGPELEVGYCGDTGGYGIRYNSHCLIILKVYSHGKVTSSLCTLKINSKWDLASFDS